MKRFKAALIGCSRMGAFIDNEMPKGGRPGAYSHAAGYEACNRTELVACSDLRTEVLEQTGLRYNVPKQKQYLDYKEMIDREQPEIISRKRRGFARRLVGAIAPGGGGVE